MNDNESNLRQGSSLQGGKYVIEKMLGQGGFGITYLGLQKGLNRRVAIKEFFMKEYCERDSGTSHVTFGSQGSRDIVDRFRTKFVKEAQTIAQLDNLHVIRIYDIFEENGTAYYVMEYIVGGSLEEYVNKKQRLDENSALNFINQIADALTYIHSKNILHLDVKPSNVLLRRSGEAVLIDFGISKRYDEQGGQTSTTPVGISKGYAPFEQYTQDGISHFEPSTDVYSLGAVLYKLLTGERPAEASMLISEGLTIPSNISSRCSAVIRKAMSSKKSERYQSAAEMKAALNEGNSFNNKNDDETEVVILNTEIKTKEKVDYIKTEELEEDKWFYKYVIGAIALAVTLAVAFFITHTPDSEPLTSNDLQYIIPDNKNDEIWEDTSRKCETRTSTVSNTTSTTNVGKINGHDYVDLGLSVKWATCNVGASTPTDYGNHYAWGETGTKSTDTTDNSKTYGKSMSDIAGDSNYDAAHTNWGGTWRLPTEEEFNELISNCEIEWTTQSGVKGRRFTSKKNGNSIFLPAAGFRDGSRLCLGGEEGYYWSSSPYKNRTGNAYFLWLNDSAQDIAWHYLSYRQSVRPVSE